MNKPRPIQQVFYAIMRITFTQMLLMTALTSLVSAAHLKGQGILDRKVSLDVNQREVQSVLSEIEKQTSVEFTYRDKFIRSFDRVSIKMEEAPLKEVLDRLFDSHVSLIIVEEEEEIVLRPKPDLAPGESVIIQERPVKGKVTDESGQPVPGVNVIEKGTTNGTTTDIDGVFSMNVRDENAVIVFSFIGYTTQEIRVGDRTNFDISIIGDVRTLGEVVVVGYGEQKKETLTGSVANISGKEIVKSPSTNVGNSLAGKLPGLIVNQRSGEPGQDDPGILVRGYGTFGPDGDASSTASAPLIVIDGVPRAYMTRLNPQDIESISVLKDASASIYGARAANGVILITTKKGVKGKPVFDLSFNHAFSQPTKVMEVLDAATFAEAFNEAEWYRAGRPASWTPFYSNEAIQKYRDGSDPVLYPNTNWVDEVFKSASVQQRFNLSATGGGESVRYFLSFGSTNQEGILKHAPNAYRQYNVRLNVDVNLTKNLTLGANLSGIIDDKRSSSTQDNQNNDERVDFTNILHANPTLVARYPNGLIAPGRLGENPLLLDQRGYNRVQSSPLFSSFTATYTVPFVKGLKLTGTYNYDLNNQFEKRWIKPYFYHEYDVNTGEYIKRQGTGSSTAELTDTYRKWTTILSNFRINYDKTFDKHFIGVMLGIERQKSENSWASAYRKNFVSTAIEQIDVGSTAPADRNNGGSSGASAYQNYLGRVNYNFSEKYLVEFLFRYDGSQIFPEGKRYGFFPGVSAGWRLSEESFLKSLTFINNLKIRASYGESGNDRVGAYQYLQSFSFGDNYVFGSADVPGIYPGVMPNPNITWEVARQTDFGIEGTFWNGLLGVDFTRFQSKRSNILVPRNVSVSNVYGFPGLPYENLGKAENSGFELVLTHKSKIGSVDYRISANTAFTRSKIVFMDEVPQDEPYKNRTGHPVGAALYYKADGVFNTQEELDAYPHLPNAQVGDTKILDLNSDDKINGADQFRFDYTAVPQHVFGITFDFGYKNFDLNLFFQGQTKAYNFDDRFGVLGSSAFDNASVYRAENRWTTENPNGTMPRAEDLAPGNNTNWLFDATFVRLKTLELGYSIPSQVISRLGLSNVRFYVSGFNVLTWAKEIKWTDPEQSGGYLYYPQQRVLNLGVNVKF